MATDLWQQLATEEVPPPPVEFDHQLHERVNKSLVSLQLIDLAVRAMPWAIFEFARAVLGLVAYSIAGRYPDRPDEKNTEEKQQ
jgi:hypothetical protein